MLSWWWPWKLVFPHFCFKALDTLLYLWKQTSTQPTQAQLSNNGICFWLHYLYRIIQNYWWHSPAYNNAVQHWRNVEQSKVVSQDTPYSFTPRNCIGCAMHSIFLLRFSHSVDKKGSEKNQMSDFHSDLKLFRKVYTGIHPVNLHYSDGT